MELNRVIESIEDVKAFISDIAWYYGVDVYEEEIEVQRSINIDFSIMHGAPSYWFEFENSENYDGNGDYIYSDKIKRSKKVVWDVQKDIELCDIQRLLNGVKHREISDEEIEQLHALEEQCKEVCDNEGECFAELVLEESEERRYQEELDNENKAKRDEYEIKEANREFGSLMDDYDAWG